MSIPEETGKASGNNAHQNVAGKSNKDSSEEDCTLLQQNIQKKTTIKTNTKSGPMDSFVNRDESKGSKHVKTNLKLNRVSEVIL